MTEASVPTYHHLPMLGIGLCLVEEDLPEVVSVGVCFMSPADLMHVVYDEEKAKLITHGRATVRGRKTHLRATQQLKARVLDTIMGLQQLEADLQETLGMLPKGYAFYTRMAAQLRAAVELEYGRIPLGKRWARRMVAHFGIAESLKISRVGGFATSTRG